MKSIKKLLSAVLATTIAATLAAMPTAVFAEQTVTAQLVKSGITFVRNGETEQADKNNSEGATFYTSWDDATITNQRRTYVKFEAEGDTATTFKTAPYVTLKFTVKKDECSSTGGDLGSTKFEVYGLTNKTFDTATLTWNTAYTADLEQFSTVTTVVNGLTVDSSNVCEIDVTDYVTSQTDGKFAFKLASDKLVAIDCRAATAVKPTLVAYSEEPAGKAAVKAAVNALSVPTVVENNELNLPQYKDSENEVTVTWTSSNTDVIEIEYGNAMVKPTDDNATVTLTATAACGNFSATKSFSVIVLCGDKEWSVPATADTHVRGTKTDKGANDKLLYTQNVSGTMDATWRRSYITFNLSAADNAKLQKADRIKLRLRENFADTALATSVLDVHGLAKKDIDIANLDYAASNTSDMEAVTNKLSSKTGFTQGEVFELDVTDYVKAQTDGKYAFKLVSTSLLGFDSLEATAADVVKPCLVAYDIAEYGFTIGTGDDAQAYHIGDALTTGTMNISLEAKTFARLSTRGRFIAALYNGAALETVSISTVPEVVSEDDGFYAYNATINIENAANRTIKLFLLEDGTLTPILDTVTLGNVSGN